MIRRPAAAVPARAAAAGAFALAASALATACAADAQETSDPFPELIEAVEGVIEVGVVEFAALPEVNGETARTMKLEHEPVTDRLFVLDQWGPLYAVSRDGGRVSRYLDVDDPRWGVEVEARGRERGVQSFALHPQFAEPGTPGHGRLYTFTDTRRTEPEADFRPGGGQPGHHTVLLEWTARDPSAEAYDGGPPRELMRFEQPFGNHNGGEIAFNPLAGPGDPDFGLLYIGSADGGAGGDPLDLAQNLGSGFGKILRVDPLGTDGPNGEYGIPADNAYAGDDDPGSLGEIYALGLRNPQHLAWDPATGDAFVADIGQSTVEEVSRFTAGANLGWNVWEGSFRYAGRAGVRLDGARGDPAMTYPVVEYGQRDPLLGGGVAVTGLLVYRRDAVPQLADRLLFGDLPSGELFHVDADDLPEGGQGAIRRVLFRHEGERRTFQELVDLKRAEQGRSPAGRADLRLDADGDGRIFLLDKHDGTLRLVVP